MKFVAKLLIDFILLLITISGTFSLDSIFDPKCEWIHFQKIAVKVLKWFKLQLNMNGLERAQMDGYNHQFPFQTNAVGHC